MKNRIENYINEIVDNRNWKKLQPLDFTPEIEFRGDGQRDFEKQAGDCTIPALIEYLNRLETQKELAREVLLDRTNRGFNDPDVVEEISELLYKILEESRSKSYENVHKTLRVKDLKKGQIVYECERGENIELVVLEDPEYSEENEGWCCRVWNARAVTMDNWGTGKIVDLFQREDMPHYGPKLYYTPQYGEEAIKQSPEFTSKFSQTTEGHVEVMRHLMDWATRKENENED